MICATLAKTDQIDGLWQQISGDIVKCIEKTPTFFTAGDLWTMCRSGAAFLIIIHDDERLIGASAWRFEDGKFVCLIMVGVSGAMRTDEDWIGALFDRAASMAKSGGAGQLMFSGRLALFHKIKRRVPETQMIRCTAMLEI